MKESLVLDSSVWIEILNSGPLGKRCESELNSGSPIIVPSLVIYEVYRKIASMMSEDLALSAITLLTQHTVADLSPEIAMTAADLSLEFKLGMADSMILAHARIAQARLVTLDHDFASLVGVKILRR